jgi:UDP-2-acetamido-3-amino-2,3-dideoxy-glucuronate N-acetyltransferase
LESLKKPRIAVLGCGYWGQNLVRNFEQLGVLGMVCDPAESGRTRARELSPGAKIVDNFEAVFQSGEVDGIAMATPAETHRDLAIRALKASKDVFVEKPLALNYRQGLEMEAEAQKAGRILMVGHLLEYHPAVLKLREMIGAGLLGRVNYIYSNRLNFGKVRIEENALWSFAPHDIAVILRLFGELPIEVTCVGGTYLTPNLPDVTVSCLHFPSGRRAHIFVSWMNPFKEQKLVIFGDKQMAVFNDQVKEGKLVLYNQRVEFANRQPVLQKGEASTVEIAADEPLRKECEHFVECIQTRQAPLTDAQSGVNVLKVLQACQISLQLNGRPILLTEV